MASFWLNSLLLVPLSALAAAAVLCHRTPDLSSVQTSLQAKEAAVHDLASFLEQTAIKQAGPVELSEGELNDFLLRRLHSNPGGQSGALVRWDRLLIDLEENRARVNFCWTVLGHPTVASVDVAVQRTKQDFTIEVLHGAYGSLEVSRGWLMPLTPAMEEAARACKPEIDALFKLPNIRIAKDKLILDPKF